MVYLIPLLAEYIVDFGFYNSADDNGGLEGTVVLKGDALRSRSRKAERKNKTAVMEGIRHVQTGHNRRGEQPLGKDPQTGKIRTIKVVVYQAPKF